MSSAADPDDPASLKRLPGIGAYTAGAIAAFAHERDVAFLDTNMRRVISRVIFGSESARESNTIEAANALVPPGQGWTWNQALIEFGALQCTARRPACIICPLRDECAAYPTMQIALQLKSSRSSHTNTQPFEGTTRFYRGRIVEALRASPEDEPAGIPLPELGLRVREGFTSENLPWLRELVEGLQRDGLAHVAEDSPAYDADRESAATSQSSIAMTSDTGSVSSMFGNPSMRINDQPRVGHPGGNDPPGVELLSPLPRLGFSPMRPSVSAVKRARWRASSGISCLATLRRRLRNDRIQL